MLDRSQPWGSEPLGSNATSLSRDDGYESFVTRSSVGLQVQLQGRMSEHLRIPQKLGSSMHLGLEQNAQLPIQCPS